MKYCKKCLYPDTKPQLEFNNQGVCSACTNFGNKLNISKIFIYYFIKIQGLASEKLSDILISY